MKRQKIVQIIAEALDEHHRIEDRTPLTVSNLTIDFEKRTVMFRGQTIRARDDLCCITFPVLDTTQMIVTKDGEVVR